MQAPSPLLARTLVLGSGAAGAIVRGLAYMPWARSSGVSQLYPVEAWLPLIAWGWVWIVVGILLASAIVSRSLSIISMSALTGLLTMWGASYIWAWIFEDVKRAWVTGALFLMTAVWSGVLTSTLERRR